MALFNNEASIGLLRTGLSRDAGSTAAFFRRLQITGTGPE